MYIIHSLGKCTMYTTQKYNCNILAADIKTVKGSRIPSMKEAVQHAAIKQPTIYSNMQQTSNNKKHIISPYLQK
jgi:hypothetical protein